MRLALMNLFAVAVLAALLIPVYGESPVELSKVAPAEDLVLESQAKIVLLEELLKDDKSFSEGKPKSIPQAAGVLACMGQAIAEHPEKDKVQAAGPALRDAALKVIASQSRDEAVAAIGEAKQALEGSASASDAKVEHEWNKLINLHRLMEEVNARNSKIRRVVRKSADPQQDSLHATTLAVLALAIHADTHEVKNEADIPKWQAFAIEYQQHMTDVATAIKKKDTTAANDSFLKGAATCNRCHEVFRKE